MAKQVEEMSEEVVATVEEVSEEVMATVDDTSEEVVAKVDVIVAETFEEPDQNPLFAMAHRVLLAAVGAAALTKEEIENFVDKLVERGEIAEKDGKKLMRDVMEKRKKETKKAEDQLEKRLDDLLGRMSVPSKGDIDALSAKITELSKKVDELKKA